MLPGADDTAAQMTDKSHRHGITALLLEKLGLAPRPEHMFSRADENFRADMYDTMTPEQRAAIDQQQTKLWANDFQRALPLARTTRDFSDWNSELSNMPAIDRSLLADQPAVMPKPLDPYGDLRMMGSADYPPLELDTGKSRYLFGGGP